MTGDHRLGITAFAQKYNCQSNKVQANRSLPIEDVARQLGLMVEQVMMPVDHLFLSALSNIPALLVVRLPAGHPHFLVVWRTHGAFVQIMDPPQAAAG